MTKPDRSPRDIVAAVTLLGPDGFRVVMEKLCRLGF